MAREEEHIPGVCRTPPKDSCRTGFPDRTLVLHAGTDRTEVGLLGAGGWSAFAASRGPTLESLFPLLEEVSGKAGLRPGEVNGLAFNRGPGSVLGLRVVSMALRTLRAAHAPGSELRFFGYSSMEVLAAAELGRGRPCPFSLALPWKRGAWRVLRVADQVPPWGIETCGDGFWHTESGGEALFLESRQSSAAGTGTMARLSDSIEELPSVLPGFPVLLRPMPDPDLFPDAPAAYRTWDRRRHSGALPKTASP